MDHAIAGKHAADWKLNHDDDAANMRSARARHFAANGFGDSGGYDDAWIHFKLGPLPLTIPNTRARKRAVPYHDLHHIVTGYSTDYIGEFEISGWEMGAGCGRYAAAWVLNLGGTAGGALRAPRRTFAAFCLGRRSHTLYGRELPELLEQTVSQTRADCGLDPRPAVKPEASDFLWFVLASALGLATAPCNVDDWPAGRSTRAGLGCFAVANRSQAASPQAMHEGERVGCISES